MLFQSPWIPAILGPKRLARVLRMQGARLLPKTTPESAAWVCSCAKPQFRLLRAGVPGCNWAMRKLHEQVLARLNEQAASQPPNSVLCTLSVPDCCFEHACSLLIFHYIPGIVHSTPDSQLYLYLARQYLYFCEFLEAQQQRNGFDKILDVILTFEGFMLSSSLS